MSFASFVSFACFVVFCFSGESWGQTLNKGYILYVEISWRLVGGYNIKENQDGDRIKVSNKKER